MESTTDHSSSSGRTRDGRPPFEDDDRGAPDLATFSCCVRRWNGFVEFSLLPGEAIDDVG